MCSLNIVVTSFLKGGETADFNASQNQILTTDTYMSIEPLNAFEITQKAAFGNPALFPIPESVMNDEIRSYEPKQNAKVFTFSNGDYEYSILGGLAEEDIRERERKLKAGFNAWMKKKQLTVPEAYQQNNDDLRFAIVSLYDYQATYDSMLVNE